MFAEIILYYSSVIQWNFFHGWSDVDDQVLWAELAAEWLGMKKRALPGSKKIHIGGRRCMFVVNHTSMADLFLMDVLFEGRCSYLARYGVIIFCPLPMIVTLVMNSIWFFKRGGRGTDLEPFFRFLDGNFDWFQTARYHLLVFPEGHRSVKPYMMPLKEGMIRYAYERKILVQPVVIFGVENAMNEFTLRKEFGSKCNMEYYASDLIDPEEMVKCEKGEPGSVNGKRRITLKEFHSKIEKVLFTEFERNHKLVCEENKRFKFLRKGVEKETYENAKEGEKCYGMVEYCKEKQKRKRH